MTSVMKPLLATALLGYIGCTRPLLAISQAQVKSGASNPLLTLCGKNSTQAGPILGKGTKGTFTWIYEGVKHSREEMHYAVGGFKRVTPTFGPADATGKVEVLQTCTATFPKRMKTWQEAFAFLGLGTQGVVSEVEGKIASNLVGSDGKPSKRLAFKHVKGLDKRYILFIDLAGEETSLELDLAVDSGFSTAKMWNWFWDK